MKSPSCMPDFMSYKVADRDSTRGVGDPVDTIGELIVDDTGSSNIRASSHKCTCSLISL